MEQAKNSQSTGVGKGMSDGTVVRGVCVPEQRFTPWAGRYFAIFLCPPFLSLCLAIDLAHCFVFRSACDSCYALLYLLD